MTTKLADKSTKNVHSPLSHALISLMYMKISNHWNMNGIGENDHTAPPQD